MNSIFVALACDLNVFSVHLIKCFLLLSMDGSVFFLIDLIKNEKSNNRSIKYPSASVILNMSYD